MKKTRQLQLMADKLRIHSIISTTAAGSGHPTSCLSCAEIISSLFFSKMKAGDEFILSKGHAAPILWAAYAEAGLIDPDELMNLRKVDSMLEGHPSFRMPMVRTATGSLGQGLATGTGMAMAMKLGDSGAMVYVLLGDSECSEGSVWEAANAASFHRLDNLVAIIDCNRLGQTGETMFGHRLENYQQRFRAFGWETSVIDGHNIDQILSSVEEADRSSKPFAIIAKTFKGRGVTFLEDREGWHGKPVPDEKLEEALSELGDPQVKLESQIREKSFSFQHIDFEPNRYGIGDMVATRDAFGNALVSLGRKNPKVVAVDAEVGNSTRTEAFFREFPERSFQAFIAEQEMAGIAGGLSALGYIPFAATFAAFWTRAHDFIRMAAYSRANIKFAGSHAGVSIGQDGPSQMGLEDIPMFSSIPGAVVLYPCDAVSTGKLVGALSRHQGISYIRTTRGKTPVIYGNEEEFPLGGLKILKRSDQDQALVIAAGITVHEALGAHIELAESGIYIRVIDLYCIKPLDEKELIRNAAECGNRVIVVEDHYSGGIGAGVAKAVGKIDHLYVRDLPRSGKPQELRKKYRIDSSAIIKVVRGEEKSPTPGEML
ncbi:MAG: transketolase [Candidatus Latescibacteria bacterium]|nr:transketolase [bacterium]MBD3425513.1 transketolase [Candidatus Latescibacterota bacterium]